MKCLFNKFLAFSMIFSSYALAGDLPKDSSSVQETAISIINEKKIEVDADLEKLDSVDALLSEAKIQKTDSKVTLGIAGKYFVGSVAYLILTAEFNSLTRHETEQLNLKHLNPAQLFIGGTLLVIGAIYAVKGGFELVMSNAAYSRLLNEKETVRLKLKAEQRQLDLLLQAVSK